METTELNKPVPTTDCTCDLYTIFPNRISFKHHYTHKCEKCGGGITREKNDNFNRFYKFSGYDDDEPDQFDWSND